jgi:hypothetical protein
MRADQDQPRWNYLQERVVGTIRPPHPRLDHDDRVAQLTLEILARRLEGFAVAPNAERVFHTFGQVSAGGLVFRPFS